MSIPQSVAPPALASRLRSVGSSPVREILALTQQPGIVSFAGGLPAPELFDAAGMRDAAAHVLHDDRVGRSLQYWRNIDQNIGDRIARAVEAG